MVDRLIFMRMNEKHYQIHQAVMHFCLWRDGSFHGNFVAQFFPFSLDSSAEHRTDVLFEGVNNSSTPNNAQIWGKFLQNHYRFAWRVIQSPLFLHGWFSATFHHSDFFDPCFTLEHPASCFWTKRHAWRLWRLRSDNFQEMLTQKKLLSQPINLMTFHWILIV